MTKVGSSIRPRQRVAVTLFAATVLVLTMYPCRLAPAAATEISDKQAQASQIADKLDELNAKLMSLANSSEVARQQLAEANQGVQAARGRADAANADMARAQAQLTSYAVDAYVSTNDSQGFDAVLTSNPDNAPVKAGYVKSLAGNRADLVDQLAAARQVATEEGDRLKAQLDDAQSESDKIDAAQREADSAVAEETRLKSEVDGQLGGLLAAEQTRRNEEAAKQADLAAKQATTPKDQTPGGASPTVRAAVPDPVPAPPSGPTPLGNGGAARAVAAAMSKVGSPYVWAAAGPDTFDCSGLTLWAWAQAGVSLPHYTGSQLAVTRPIPISDLQAGDLVFIWGPGESGAPGHVGLYIGGGQMVHAPHSGAFVEVDSIYWWTGSRIAAGRVT